MSNRTIRRLASLSVSLLVTLGLAATASSPAQAAATPRPAAMSAATTTNCGTGGCGPYYIRYTYTGGTVVEYDYTSQWQWMQDATEADLRGYHGYSSYAHVEYGNNSNSPSNFEVQANYCAGGGCFSDKINGSNSGETGWKHKAGSCSTGYQTESEALAWIYYLDAVWRVDAGKISLAALLSPAGNTASYSVC